MANVLTPAPRTYSFNIACDVLERNFNPAYRALDDSIGSVFTLKAVNDSVTLFYIGSDLVAMYDEASGDLWGAWDKVNHYRALVG